MIPMDGKQIRSSLSATLLAALLAFIAAPASACVGTIINQTGNVYTVIFSDHNFRGPLCWVTADDECPPLSSSDRGYRVPAGEAMDYAEALNDGTWIHIEREDRVARQDSFWQSQEIGNSCERAWITNGDTSNWGLLFNDPAPGDIVILAN